MSRPSSRPRIHLATLGCAKNLVDSERLLGRLAAAGAIVGAPPEEADVILVNTCGFIAPARDESVQTILRLAAHKRRGRCRKLIVLGCLAQRYAEELRRELPEADAIFGLRQEARIVAACGLSGGGRETGRLVLTPRHTAYLRIADGCDNRCAYCTIPSIRGPFRSRPWRDILAEAKALTAGGARELILVGQDTTLYGTDREDGVLIHELLARLADLPDLRWLRLLYTHPAHFTEDLVRAYATVPKLCPYVDLPLQHLNDDILRRMGRRVTQRRCLDLIARLRAAVRDIAIRTTFIVGFPGETRARFDELFRLVQDLRFDQLGVFSFSPEEGTRAARMSDRVSERTKERRHEALMLAQQEIVFERNRAMKGCCVEALIESAVPGRKDTWIGRTVAQSPDVDSVTHISGKDLRAGQFRQVRISGSSGYDLLARADARNGAAARPERRSGRA